MRGWIPVVRQRRETPSPRHAKPRSALLEVPACEDVRSILPEARRGGRSTKPLVAVRGDYEVVARVGTQREKDQTHRSDDSNRATPRRECPVRWTLNPCVAIAVANARPRAPMDRGSATT